METLQATETVRAIDGRVVVAHGDNWVAVHSPRNPLREAETLVQQALGGRPSDVLVVVGLGLGFVLDVLDERGWTGRVLALEPEPGLVPHLHARRDLRAWLETGRLVVAAAPAFDGAADCWRWFDEGAVAPPIIMNVALARIRPDETRTARALVERLMFDARANAEARRKFGAPYLLNTLRNITAVAEEGDVAALAGAMRRMPAIVVAAGPSLDENIEALRAVDERAVIIAVDTAVRPLLAAGITPHFAVAVDPGEANVRHLWDLPPCPDTCLVAEASVDPAALAPFRGRTFLFSVDNHQPWPWLAQHGAGRGRLAAFGSVLTTAFDLALQLGCDPVVFAGADLAFTHGRCYARGVAYEEEWARYAAWGRSFERQQRDSVEYWKTEAAGVNGEVIPTAPHLVAFRDWLVQQMNRTPDRRFVNATGGGILHGRQIEQTRLATVVAGLPSASRKPREIVRERYRPRRNERLLLAAERLLAGASDTPVADAQESPARNTADEPFTDVNHKPFADANHERVTDVDHEPVASWERFAPGLTREQIFAAVADALQAAPPPVIRDVDPAARAAVAVDDAALSLLVANMPLEALIMPPERMHPVGHVHRFQFRTTVARVMCCVLQLPDGAIAEDGQAMRRGGSAQSLRPGEYWIERDSVFIVAGDASDPRTNRRTYSVLVPRVVARAESQTLQQILASER